MAGKRIVALSLFTLVVLTIGLFASSGAQAVGTYKPVGIYSLLTDMPGVASSAVTNVSIPSPNYNYEDSSMYNLSPVAGWTAPGELFPLGAWMGELTSTTTLGVTNKACNLPVSPFFNLFNASTDTSQQLTPTEMAWTNTDIAPPTGTYVSQRPDYLVRYPHFLNLMLDPDGPTGPLPPLKPRARYAGHTNVVGSWMLIEIVILSPGQIAQLPGIKAQMLPGLGYTVLTVLNNPVDQREKPGSVSDFCTALQSITTLYGTTRPGAYVAGGPYGVGAGLVAQVNPANNSGILATNTHLNRTYSQSERDVDGDGWENDMDPCFYQANPGWNPRLAPPTPCGAGKPGDVDCDGLPDICDPEPNGVDDGGVECDPAAPQFDCDNDGYNNQQDICPLVADGPLPDPVQNQLDSDGLVGNADLGPQPDSIGNACDDSDDDGNEDGAGVGTCNDGLDNGGDTLADGNDPNCNPASGCTGMDKAELAQVGPTCTPAQVWGTNPGSGLYFHAMPWAPVCIGGAETGAQCDNDTDNDGDGVVNDGCPPIGNPEGDLDPTECTDALDENTQAPNDEGDAAPDKVNDGCPTVNPNVDADGDGYCDATEAALSSDTADATEMPESYVIDASIIGVGANVNPALKAAQSCSDGIDNDDDGATDADDSGCTCPTTTDPDCDGVATTGPPSDNCSTVWNPEQTNFDGDSQGDACDLDDDNDTYNDDVEWWLGTDPLEDCPKVYTLASDAWPLDMNQSQTVTVVGDVLKYAGKIGGDLNSSPPTSWSLRRLDLNKSGTITVVGDVLKFAGKIGGSCT